MKHINYKFIVFLVIFTSRTMILAAQVEDSGILEKITIDTLTFLSPSKSSKTIDASRDFNVNLSDSSMSVWYLKQKLPIHTIADLDNYIKTNLQNMHKIPVVIRGASNLKYSHFNEILEVLKKYKIYHFSVVTASS